MPPTNEQLLLNSGSVQITPPQVQEGIAPTPIYKEGGISMPSPQAWIGPIDYGFNWYAIGEKAFKVAGDIYKDVLDYNLRRRQQQATQDLTEMQTISVEKPDPTYTPEQQREWLIGQNSRLNKKAKESLLKQGLTQEQIDGVFGISATGERLDKPVNPADYILPASDMNSVLQIIRYNNLTSEEFKTNIQKVEDNIFERAKANWFDGSSKQFGNLDNPDLTPEQVWQNRQKAIEALKKSTYNDDNKNKVITTLIQQTDPDFNQAFKTKLIQNYNKKQEEATYRFGLYMDDWLNGKTNLQDFVDASSKMFDDYATDAKRDEIYLSDPTFDTSTEASKQKIQENPDLAWQINSNKVKQLDIRLSMLQRKLINADSNTVNKILEEQKQVYNQRTQELNTLVSNTQPELLSEKERREFEWYSQQKNKLTQEAGQEKVKEIKLSEVKPTLDSIQEFESKIQQLSNSINSNTKPEDLDKTLKSIKELEQNRFDAIKTIANLKDDPNRPQELQRIIDSYKQLYSKQQEEITQASIKTIKANEIKPTLDSIQTSETTIQTLRGSIKADTKPEQLSSILNQINTEQNKRLGLIKKIVDLPDDPNRPQEIQKVIDSYKQLYNRQQEEVITQNINTIVNNSVLNIQTKLKQEDQRIDVAFQLLMNWQNFTKTTRLPTKKEFNDILSSSGLNKDSTSKNAYNDFIELLPEEKNKTGVLNTLNNKDAVAKLKSIVYSRVLNESGIGVNNDGTLINPNEINIKIQQELAKISLKQNGNTQDSFNTSANNVNSKYSSEQVSDSISLNRPGITQQEASDGVMFKWQNLMQDITPKPSMFDVFKVWEPNSFNQIAFQISTQDESRKRFVDLMLFNPQFINKQDMKAWIRSGWNEVTSGTNVKDIDQKTYTLGFFTWLSNRIPSGSSQQGLEQSKFNSDFLLKEYDKFWQAHLQTKDRLKQFGLDAKTMRILDIAATSGMESTSGWFSNYGGTKIMDYIQTINPTNGDTAVSMYANMLGLPSGMFAWDTDKAKAIVRASSEIGGDFISPFILAISTLPPDASADLIVDTALHYADQFGFNLQTTLQVTGSSGNWSTTKTPIASTDSLNRTLGLSSPTAPIKNIPYSGSENFPLVYSATAVQQLGLTADNLVYGKILPNLKQISNDGKVTPWIPNEEQTQDYLITRDNILDIAASFYPGSVTADSLKTDPDYPIMQFLFDWFDDKTDKPINERLADAFEHNKIVQDWVFRYSNDQGKTPDPSSSSRAAWLGKQLLNKNLTLKPFIELVLNSSAHIPTEITGNVALQTQYSIFRSLDQYEGSFTRQTRGEKDYLPSQVNEVLPDKKNSSILIPTPTSGEPFILLDPISRKPLIINQNSEYSLKINNALQKGYDSSWYNEHLGETWLFMDLLNLRPIEININNTHDIKPNFGPYRMLSFDSDKNIFNYEQQEIFFQDSWRNIQGRANFNFKGSVLPIRRLK